MKDTAAPRAEPDRQARMKVPGLREILDYARWLGWRRTFFRGAYVATNQLVTLSIFDCFRLRREDIITELSKTDAGYECRFLAPDETDRFAGQLESKIAANLHMALARGDAAYAILDGERLASIGLYAKEPTPILNDLAVHFEPPARYMYHGYTQVEYRGRRLHALGILRAAQELFDLQVPNLVTVCERTNYPARISVNRMGWQPCGTLYRIRIGPWLRFGQTVAARKNGMSLRLGLQETIN
jgi:hypothetical protein